jgi:hypothetical protein
VSALYHVREIPDGEENSVVILIGCQYFSSNCPQQNLARSASRKGVIEIGLLIEVFFEFMPTSAPVA